MIPSHAHFIWLGPRLPPLGYYAVRSALAAGGFERVTLHHDRPELAADPLVQDLGDRGAILRPLDVSAWAADADGLADGVRTRLLALERTLTLPSSRSNLHRLEVLWREGGVYLDTDVLVVRPFAPLLAAPGFAGVEPICFPGTVKESLNPLRWARAGALTALRAGVCGLAVSPSRAFRRVERLYPVAANNAVLAAEPRHPLVRELLERAARMDDRQAHRRYRLGTHLLQDATGNRSQPGFVLHPPAAFYPLPPEVCVEYVSTRSGARVAFGPETYAAHLYDSVLRLRARRPLDAAYFAETRGRTPLARLVEPYLDDLLSIEGRRSRSVARG